MPTEIVFTALPTGRTADRFHLSVHLSPRLTADGPTLASYPPMVEWPPRDLSFEVAVGAATYRGVVVSQPDPSIWPLIFGPNCPVTSFTPADNSGVPVHTYPIAKIARFLQVHYTQVAIGSPDEHPAVSDLLDAGFRDISFVGREGAERWNQAKAALDAALSSAGAVDTRAPSADTFDFVQLKDFFAPVDLSDPADAAAFDEPVRLPELDFHRAVHACNQHPPLLRLLGLVFDLDIDTRGNPPPAGPTSVAVVPRSEALAQIAARTPVTRAAVGADSFEAVPRPGTTHLAAGFLRLDDTSQYRVLQVEAIGGALKAVEFAGNLSRSQLHPTSDTPTRSALPALRADGFAVVRVGAAVSLHERLLQLAGYEAALAAGTLELYAEDLVRAHRIDVWDGASQGWHSVMQRIGTYELGGGTVGPIGDEGFTATDASRHPVGADDLYLGETVFWWDGWSLVAPRPGRTLGLDPQASDPMVDRPPNEPGLEFPARFRFDVAPGTLPSLRYGVDYGFRVRTVDLAGNSLPAESTDTTHASPLTTFGRFEPLAAPTVLLRAPRGPGESMETIALRSNFDAPPEPTTAERHLAPAKVGQLTVERHGVLDVASASDPNLLVLDGSPTTYAELSLRDAANLANHPDGMVDPDDVPDNRYFPVDQLIATWTPDPAARAIGLRLLDGPHAGFVGTFPLLPAGSSWPAMQPIRLVVVEGSGPPSFDATARRLVVPLGKADVVRARLSSVLDPAELTDFGLWHWVDGALAPADPKRDELTQRVGAGGHWMFEPFRPLRLFHAVRQPLATPEFPSQLTVARSLGDTFAVVSRRLSFSRKSTGRVDMWSSWSLPVDGGPGAAPPDVEQPFSIAVQDQPFSLTIRHDEDLDPGIEVFAERHELRDTKHRMVTYRAVATTRFAEFFTSRQADAYGGPSSVVVLGDGAPTAGVVAGSVKAALVDGDGQRRPLVDGRDFLTDLAAGTVSFTTDAPPGGDTVETSFLVPPITRESVAPQLISVPSSARPAAPKVLYAVPAFQWTSTPVVQGGQQVGMASQRAGNTLRIYLDRPWWSSGEGELLGVLTWPGAEPRAQGELDDDDPLRPFVTQWGSDPIYASAAAPSRYPRLNAFTKAVATTSGAQLSLAELGPDGPKVNVAGHAVGYDDARELWYCDVAINAGATYQPFVRLALARYQPASIPNAHLSPVVLADYIQLAPSRAATVVRSTRTSVQVTVAGPVATSTDAASGAAARPCRVTVEQRQPAIGDPDLGWKAVATPVALSGSVSGGVATWSGPVTVPAAAGQGNLRLVIEQFEVLGLEQKNNSANPFLPGKAERLVYSDLLIL